MWRRWQDQGEAPVALLSAWGVDAEIARIAKASDEVSRGGPTLGEEEFEEGRTPHFCGWT
jgi:hypothetical protein